MIRLELGRGFRKADNDRIDGRGHQTKQCGAQDETDGRTHKKGPGQDGPTLLHEVAHQNTEDPRQNTNTDAHHQQDCIH